MISHGCNNPSDSVAYILYSWVNLVQKKISAFGAEETEQPKNFVHILDYTKYLSGINFRR